MQSDDTQVNGHTSVSIQDLFRELLSKHLHSDVEDGVSYREAHHRRDELD